MTSQTFSIYDVATGAFVGKTLVCALRHLPENVPDGCGCILGEFDHMSYRVDLETGQVVDYQPPRPTERHEWDETIRRWVYVPTAAEVCRQQRALSYPPVTELADALFWQARGDSSRLDAYLAACEAVKQRFPKPEE